MMSINSISELGQQFDEQGYVILRGFLEPSIIDGIRVELDMLVDQFAEKLVADGKIRHIYRDEPFTTRWLRLYEGRSGEAPNLIRPELHLPGFFDLFFHPILLDLVQMVLGPEIRLYPNYSSRPKLPQQEKTLVLWHQDGGYTEGQTEKETISISDLRMVNVWTPLVTAHEEQGCMQFIPGTHKLGHVPHEKREFFLEISQQHLAPHVEAAISIEMDPGDIVLFHNLLFHQGLPNRSNIVRWNVDWRYQDATQPTLRKENGHLARSRQHPEQVVKSAEQWANLSFT